MQTRTARFASDGHFEVGYSDVFPYERYALTVQAFPWLEGTFRYTSIENRSFSGDDFFGQGGTSFKDRAIDAKFLIVPERRWLPQIAVGFQDALGTGLFSGEYLVASKRFFDLDFTVGFGWGYTAGRGTIKNPLIAFSDGFRDRGGGGREGGTFLPSAWFSGERISLFGGVEYATPIRGLSLKLEYDPHNYAQEPVGNRLISTSRLNYGVNLRPYSYLDIGLGWERGQRLMLRGSIRTNLNDSAIPKFDPPPAALTIRPKSVNPPKPSSDVPPPTATKQRRAFEPWLDERMRAGGGANSGEIADALAVLGFPVASVSTNARRTTVRLWSETDEPRELAQYALAYNDTDPATILVLSPRRERVFEVNDLVATTGVDFLFADLRELGASIREVRIDGRDMFVFVEGHVDATRLQGSISPEIVLPPSVATLAIFQTVESAERLLFRFERGAITSNFAARETSTNPNLVEEPVEPAILNRPAIAAAVFENLTSEGLQADRVLIDQHEVTVFLMSARFRQTARNIGRAVRVTANSVPDDVEFITIALGSSAGELARVTVRRDHFEKALLGTGSAEEVFVTGQVSGPQSGEKGGTIHNVSAYPNFKYGIGPGLKQHIGSGDQFLLYQAFVGISGGVQFTPGLSVDGAVVVDLYNNFDRLSAISDSVLPKVRSDIRSYLQEGENSILRLQTNYYTSPTPDFFLRFSAGYFETMYGGFGGEFLYRPFGARFAAGIDLNYVRQRDFDQLFSFRDYTTLTGHLNLYYNLPIYDLLAEANIGQYLAGDRGITITMSRLFKSGIRAGAFFTVTDVPFEVFGEGSFDKGFFLTLPLDLFSTRSSTNFGIFAFRPLTKDVGQKLVIRPRLYEVVGGLTAEEVARDWDQLLN